jgi:phosphopantetheinyl transferase (holo-ACP synthase)
VSGERAWACVTVDYASARRAEELTAPLRPDEVLSRAERRTAHGLSGLAGRLAAKRAVLRALGFDEADPRWLRRVEILPDHRRCLLAPGHLAVQHPPRVVLTWDAPGPAPLAAVSLAHCGGRAVAVASVCPPLPGFESERGRGCSESVECRSRTAVSTR